MQVVKRLAKHRVARVLIKIAIILTLIWTVGLMALSVLLYWTPGDQIIPVYLMLESAAQDYRCDKGKWPTTTAEFEPYVRKDPNLLEFRDAYNLTYTFEATPNGNLKIRIKGRRYKVDFEKTRIAHRESCN